MSQNTSWFLLLLSDFCSRKKYFLFGKLWISYCLSQVCESYALLALFSAFVWLCALYEERIEAFEMKCIRKILIVSWTLKKANEWVLEAAGVERDLLNLTKKGESYHTSIVWWERKEIVWRRDHAGICTGSEKARETKDATDWQHGKMNWNVVWQATDGNREQKEME